MSAVLDPAGIDVLLCDADGNLFPSEEPAFAASVGVVNALMREMDSPRRFAAEELRRATTGQNFRQTAQQLARSCGHVLPGTALERWVEQERLSVTAHLVDTLITDSEVQTSLRELDRQFDMALVTSSAAARVDACLQATGLAWVFAPSHRFSAEDSLPSPRSKPHPDVYLHALDVLGIDAHQALAIEDSAVGVRSASQGGVAAIGNLAFVARDERGRRRDELLRAGAQTVVSSWPELVELVGRRVAA